MATSIRASASTTVSRTVADVFEYLSTVETMDDWVVGVSETTLVSGVGGSVGDLYEAQYEYGGRTTTIQLELTAVERPNRISMRSSAGPFPFEGTLTLVDEGDRTRITNTIDAGSDSRFTTVLFTLLKPLMRWLMARQLRSELDDLQTILESTDAGSRNTASTSAS